MKKLFLFLAVASMTAFTSCSSDDDSSGPATDPNAATSVILSSNVETVQVGEMFTFVLTDNKNNIVTASADTKFYADNVVLTSPTFTPTAPGSFTIRATYKNTNGLELASNEIIVKAVPAPSNSLVLGGTSYETASGSMLYYLGTTAGSINVFVANAYKEVGEGEAAEYPNDTYVYFTSAQVDTEFIDWPVAGAYAYSADTAAGMKAFDANLILNDEEVLATEVTTNVTLNISNIVNTETARTWAFTYSVLMADNTTAKGEFHGDYGFANASQGAGKANVNAVNKVSNAQIKANLIKVMNSKK
ncbi:hypothetical protein FLAN108750_11395 [Flavobacterium antarcticum]|uniref:hypothetical protein n=1 Tax=Flavobacterium antarcticum TaxID=271155 RepID=UPI0003B58161|nr:hypothetical protein [Flavobacterium antarcticum]